MTTTAAARWKISALGSSKKSSRRWPLTCTPEPAVGSGVAELDRRGDWTVGLRLLLGVATFLGLTESELQAQLAGGKTLADVARARGKTVDGLFSALVADEKKEWTPPSPQAASRRRRRRRTRCSRTPSSGSASWSTAPCPRAGLPASAAASRRRANEHGVRGAGDLTRFLGAPSGASVERKPRSVRKARPFRARARTRLPGSPAAPAARCATPILRWHWS